MEQTGSNFVKNIYNNRDFQHIKEYQDLQISILNVLRSSGFAANDLSDEQKSYATINVLKLLLGNGKHLDDYLKKLRSPYILFN